MSENPKYEVISKEERVKRDPHGRNRVTLLGDSVIIRTDQFPVTPEVKDDTQEEAALDMKEEENTDG